MGLALHNNSSSALESLSQGPSQVASRPRPRAHYEGAYGPLPPDREHADQGHHLLDLVLLANHQRRAQRRRRTSRRRTRQPRSVSQRRPEETVGFPVEAAPQLRRTPSLERQGAFRAPSTAKNQMGRGEGGDFAELYLYRLGLLYHDDDDDDKHLRGEGFGLGSIAHDGPGSAVHPAKPAARRSRRSYEDNLQLALDLSLAELGRDEAFARYLLSPDLDETIPTVDEPELGRLCSGSGLISPPDSICGEAPDLATRFDSDPDPEDNHSTCFDEDDRCTITCLAGRGDPRSDKLNDDVSDDAWMVLGDGS